MRARNCGKAVHILVRSMLPLMESSLEPQPPLPVSLHISVSNMAPKEPTRAQLSSRLAYSSQKPAFLQKLENRIAGVPDDEEEDGDEWENLGGDGRVPIPRRPKEKEDDTEESEGRERDEEGEEMPQIVVLRQGKHLTEAQVRQGTWYLLYTQEFVLKKSTQRKDYLR